LRAKAQLNFSDDVIVEFVHFYAVVYRRIVFERKRAANCERIRLLLRKLLKRTGLFKIGDNRFINIFCALFRRFKAQILRQNPVDHV
jgi:hypothetical protein